MPNGNCDRDRYHRRKAKGVCVHCGGARDNHTLRCSRCRATMNSGRNPRTLAQEQRRYLRRLEESRWMAVGRTWRDTPLWRSLEAADSGSVVMLDLVEMALDLLGIDTVDEMLDALEAAARQRWDEERRADLRRLELLHERAA